MLRTRWLRAGAGGRETLARGRSPEPREVSVEVIAAAGLQIDLQIRLIRHDAEVTSVQLTSELDGTNTDLRGSVLDAAGAGHRVFRVDLSGLGFCDCAGLRAVLHAHDRQLSRGATLVLTGLSPTTRRLLAITHLDEVLLIQYDEQSAPLRTSSRRCETSR